MPEQIGERVEREPLVGFDIVNDKKHKIFILKPKNSASRELIDKYSNLLQGYVLNAKRDSEQSIRGSLEQIPYGDSGKGLVLPYTDDSGKETAMAEMEKIKLFLESEKGAEEIETSHGKTQKLIAEHEKTIFNEGEKVFQASQES